MVATLVLGASLLVAGVRGQFQQCDTGALMGDIGPLTDACCPNGDQCSRGPPTSCSQECAEVFLPFMDTYNHGSCMAMLQMMGQSLHLGDLEVECRESLTTDGGEDASAVDCSPAGSMSIVLACSQETGADAMFCESTCFSVLSPWYEVCQTEMPSYMQAMMAVPLGLMQQCDEDSAAAGEAMCDMSTLMAVCMAPDAGLDGLDGEDPMAACENACIQQLLPCKDNPMLAMMFGPETVEGFNQLDSMCSADASDGGPGDGVCEMGGFMAMAADPAMDPENCGEDIMCTCHNGLIQEMIDCQSNPMFAENQDDIASLETLCSTILAGEGGAGGGDGTCQLELIMVMGDDPAMDPDTCGDDLMCLCNNAMIQEMFDCRGDPSAALIPELAEANDELADLQTSCVAITGPGGIEGSAGDHVCSEMSAAMLCDDEELDAAVSGGQFTGAELCSHPCVQELMDCIDSPLVAEDRATLVQLQSTCSGPQVECLPIIMNMDTYFDEACCTGAGLGPCSDGPPATCTTGCSAMYLPFYQDCGSVVTGLGQGSDDFAEVASALETFNTVCTTAHPGKTRPGNGGH